MDQDPTFDPKRTALGLGFTPAEPGPSRGDDAALLPVELPKRTVVVDWGTHPVASARPGDTATGPDQAASVSPPAQDRAAHEPSELGCREPSEFGCRPLEPQSPEPPRGTLGFLESTPPSALTVAMVTPLPARRLQVVARALLTSAGLIGAATIAAATLGLRTGRILVDASTDGGQRPEIAEVFVDGHKVGCDALPCAVSNVPPGQHFVQVVAPGFGTHDRAVATARAGDEVAFAVLLPSAPQTGISVEGDAPGVELVVDGVRRGALPARVMGLSAGPHRIRFQGARYEATERTVHVTAGQVLELGAPELRVARGLLTVEVASPGARLVLVRGRDGDRRALHGPFPMNIEVGGDERWTLIARKRGADAFERPIDFSDGRAVKNVRVDLR